MTAKVMAVFAVQILLWLYLVWRGRTPERVLISMNLMLVEPLVLFWTGALKHVQMPAKVVKTGDGTVSGDSVYLCGVQIKTVRAENVEQARWNRSVGRSEKNTAWIIRKTSISMMSHPLP